MRLPYLNNILYTKQWKWMELDSQTQTILVLLIKCVCSYAFRIIYFSKRFGSSVLYIMKEKINGLMVPFFLMLSLKEMV
jgi:hypothetical protein